MVLRRFFFLFRPALKTKAQSKLEVVNKQVQYICTIFKQKLCLLIFLKYYLKKIHFKGYYHNSWWRCQWLMTATITSVYAVANHCLLPIGFKSCASSIQSLKLLTNKLLKWRTWQWPSKWQANAWAADSQLNGIMEIRLQFQ